MKNQRPSRVGVPSRESAIGENESHHITNTIGDIIKLESLERTVTERVAESIATFTGSMFFIWLHVFWFVLWIVFNSSIPWLGFLPVDPFPFTLLTMIVSLEAIFLSAFILMSENRQGRLADQRARVDLQVNMIAEREITKLLELVIDIHTRLGIQKPDDIELEHMQKVTDIEHLTKAAQTVEVQKISDSLSNGLVV